MLRDNSGFDVNDVCEDLSGGKKNKKQIKLIKCVSD